MEADHSSEASEASYITHYCSVAEAMKLITHPFDGNKKKLREFIENVDVAFELFHPSKHEILLKFVKTKITGDADQINSQRFNACLGISLGNPRR